MRPRNKSWDAKWSAHKHSRLDAASSVRAAFARQEQARKRVCLCGAPIEQNRARTARLCWACHNKVMARRAAESARRWR